MRTKPRRRSAIAALFAAAIALLLALPAFASADPLGSITEYSSGLQESPYPGSVAPGPEGNVWFIDSPTAGGSSHIGRITPGGTITEFSTGLNAGSVLVQIAAGPEGNLWFTDKGTTPAIGKINPSTHAIEEFSIEGEGGNAGSVPQGIVAAAGNLWFADFGATPAIGKINPTTHAIEEFSSGLNAESAPHGIAAGPDGNLWFTDGGTTPAIGKINPTTHAIEEFSSGLPAGSEPGGSFGSASIPPWGIAPGPDGNVWFTDTDSGIAPALGRITPAGVITEFSSGLSANSRPHGMTLGPDGNLWFTDENGVAERQEVKIEAAEELGGNFKLCFKSACTGATGTGDVEEESNEVLNVTTSTGSFVRGEELTGTGLEAGTTITEVQPEALILSENATETNTGVSLTANLQYKMGRVKIGEALEKLPTVGAFNVSVEGSSMESPIERTVEFTGELGATDVPPLTCNGTGLTGTSPTCTVTTTRAGSPNSIGRITPSGTITEFPANGATVPEDITSGPDGNLWFANAGSTRAIGKFGIEEETGLPLKVTHEGSGAGTVQSNPAGITCTSGECEHKFAEGETVELTASPSAGSAFVAWKNCDSGGVHGRECTVHVTPGHKTVGAKFEPANTVTVKTKGTGTGSVSGVTCGNTCTEASGIFVATKAVTLKAKPYAKNSEFIGWSASPASCTLSEEGKTCSLGLLGANETVEAEFKEIARETLTVAKSGSGQGSVKSAPAGINCSYTCGSNAAYYYKGTSVTLTAAVQVGKGSALGNWGGACSGTEATPCVVTMSGAKSVTAEFK